MKSSDQRLTTTQYGNPGLDNLNSLLSEQFANDRAMKRRNFFAGAFVASCVGVIGLQFIV